MANEILVVDIESSEADFETVNFVFLFPISPQIVVNAIPVAPTPAALLPPLVLSQDMLTVGELALLDDGVLGFISTSLRKPKSTSDNDFLLAVRDNYAELVPIEQSRLQRKYQRSGMRRDP